MFRKSPGKIVILAALLVLAAVGGGLWLLQTLGWFAPAPTRFGWQADLATVAGDGVRGHADGAPAGARFSDPFAVAIDARGALYVADAGDTKRVRKIDADGTVTTLPGSFDTPSGIALDTAGNIIVADTGANAIRMISPAGAVTTLAGDGVAGLRDGVAAQARFNGPIGVAADDKGNVYVADSYNDRIRLITPDGQVRTLAGGDAPGFADGQGAAAAFDTPSGLAIDRHGALLVADTGNDAIRKVDKDGLVSTVARTDPGDGAGLLKAPIALAPTWDGFLYIASFRRARIVQISPTGELRVLAGPGAAIDGNAALPLTGPAGLAIDRAGALYVADASAYAIRKLTPRRAGASAKVAALEPAPPALVRAPVFPWPVAPQYGWHEVVGDMGEVRGNYQGESRDHLHAGLDISAPVGEQVLASANETVQDPLPNWDVEGLSEGLRIDQLTYIHMRVGRSPTGAPLDPARFQVIRDAGGHVTRVRVKRGTRFRVGDPLGTINRMAHVHLELGPPRAKVNALLLHFPGFADHIAPHIDDVHILDGAGQRLTEMQNGRLIVLAAGGTVAIVAEAWDQVDGNAARRRLGLYRAGFQILKADGTPVRGYEQPRITLEFDRMPTAADAAKIAYAPASGDTVHSDQRTRFLYVVTNMVRHGHAAQGGWNPADIPPGNYTIRIYAADRAGNVASTGRDLPITIR
ncbi:MAG: NHL repeat-containing protein [Candidatus Sphingomonas phytovorans]|nr:NHL repeat-containing protein [Sphingomonas sp.]WEK02275.1 MAG: NHL repeat-containing protein [Sphingomonas sp.]